jgi:hypothetical protein
MKKFPIFLLAPFAFLDPDIDGTYANEYGSNPDPDTEWCKAMKREFLPILYHIAFLCSCSLIFVCKVLILKSL